MRNILSRSLPSPDAECPVFYPIVLLHQTIIVVFYPFGIEAGCVCVSRSMQYEQQQHLVPLSMQQILCSIVCNVVCVYIYNT